MPYTQEIKMQVDWSKPWDSLSIKTLEWEQELQMQVKESWSLQREMMKEYSPKKLTRHNDPLEFPFLSEDSFYDAWEKYEREASTGESDQAFEAQLDALRHGEIDFDEQGNLILVGDSFGESEEDSFWRDQDDSAGEAEGGRYNV